MSAPDENPTTSDPFHDGSPSARLPRLAELVRCLDAAVNAPELPIVTASVEAALTSAIGRGDQLIPAAYHEPIEDHYGRRLLHRDPRRRYSVICMTWGPGQGTPLHDHGDVWGSVAVYRGRLRVTPYELEGEPDADLWRLRKCAGIVAGRGAADSVLPPDDHHTIENPFDEASISIHVYGSFMESCAIFVPTEAKGVYRREVKTLVFDPS